MKNHAAPFLFAVFILIAVLLLQFLMKFADKLVGKGLSTWVIAQLITYNLAWMLVLVIPMAVLVAVLMAFGSMAQNNEIAIMKASGISLYKMMISPFIASIFLAYLLVQFNNFVYPSANHAARIIIQDISKKKPTLSLVPGVFSQEVQFYSILVKEINETTGELKDIIIYDNSEPGVSRIVTAEEGKIYFSGNQKKLLMDLYNGEIHESPSNESENYRKYIFKKHRIAMNGEQFSFQQSSLGGPRSDREMGAPEMITIVDSLKSILKKLNLEYDERLHQNFATDTTGVRGNTKTSFNNPSYLYMKVEDKMRSAKSSMNSTIQRIEVNRKSINRYWVEIHKKYSLPVACIIFILIGAPLGTMTRKGGFGMAAGISLFFFLVYWAFLIGGEKLADRGLLSPFWGMWSANITLGLLGLYLTVKAAKERVTLSFEFMNKFLPKQWRSNTSND